MECLFLSRNIEAQRTRAVAGVAGLPLESDRFRYGLDGVNQWQALTTPGGAAPARGPDTGLVHEVY
jgi:hypothetical protein